MSQGSPPLDYEGVTRTGQRPSQWDSPEGESCPTLHRSKSNPADSVVGSRPSGEESEEQGSDSVLPESWPPPRAPVAEPISASREPDHRPIVELATRVKSSGGKRQEAGILRGHSLTFLALFLFTADVFLRPYELFTSLSFLKSSAFWIAIFTLMVYVPTQLGLKDKLTTRPREVNLALLLLLAVSLSIPLALDPLRAWNGFLDYLKVVLMFIVTVNVVRTEKRLKLLLLLVIAASCILSVSAISDYVLGNLVLRGERIAGLIGGLFQNPNDLALHLVTMIPLAVVLVFHSRSSLKKIFYLTSAVLMTAGLLVTFSRGGFLGLACAGAMLASRIVRRNKALIFLAMPVILLFLFVVAPSANRDRLSTMSDGSALARQDDLKRSLFIAARHPLLGVGIDNYVMYSNSNHATHNAYTQVAAEAGLAAAICYILFLFTPLKQLRRIGLEISASGSRPRIYYLIIGLEASLIGYMVSSFFASVAFLWYAYYLVAYGICLRGLYEAQKTANAGTLNEENREELVNSELNQEYFGSPVRVGSL